MDSGTIATVVTVALGGLELRWSVHKALSRLRQHHVRIAALEDNRAPPDLSTGSDPFGDTPAMQHPARRIHRLGLVAIIAGVFAFGLVGCNEAQIARAQAMSDAADAKLAAADAARLEAQRALAAADELAKQIGGEKAQQLVATAKAAVDAATSAEDVAKVAAGGAHDAVAAAKAAQDAGSSTIGVLAAAAAALVPTAGGLIAAIAAAVKSAQQFRQTVAGVDAAKARMTPEAVDVLHAELAKAQDQSTKLAVDAVQAASAAKGS